MEEYDRYICKDMKGLYSLIFRNIEKIKREEIEEIFSKYGTVAEVKAAGDLKGYHFVRYPELEQAKFAMMGMKNHSRIKLLQHTRKDKNNDRNRQNNFFGNKNSRVQDQICHKENEKINKSTVSVQNSVTLQNVEKNNELNDTISSSTSVPSLKEDSNKATTRHEDTNTYEDILIVDEVPDLVASNKNMEKPVFLDANEVIVGNIPDNHSSAYMLHLFQKWTPLAVTDISTTKNNIRFCRLYLMSEKDAYEIESRFDKMELSGQKLVVLRPNQLIKESNL